ncbi:MAG: ABC transporter ATP-binding protein [Clostridiales bacterium]|nr:ABC transporter ATP-binding protein [Clostridiales bacterium]
MDAFKEQEYNKSIDFGLWKGLLKYIKPYKKKLITLALAMIGVGAVDVAFPLMTKYAIDNFIETGRINGLWGFAGVFLGLVVFQAVNVYFFIDIAGAVELDLGYDIRKAGFKKLQELSFSYYDKTSVGWLMARMTSDIERLGATIAWSMVDLAWGLTMMIGGLIAMFYMNWKLTLITLSVVPFLAVISLYFQKRILAAYRVVRKTNSKITGAFNEGIMGAKTTKTLVREDENLKEFSVLTGKMYHSAVRAVVFSSIYLPIVTTMASIGTALALWSGGRGVVLGVVGFGTLSAFISYTAQFFHPVRDLARIFAEFQNAQASAERVMAMLNTQPDIKDSPLVIEKYGTEFAPKHSNWEEIEGDVSFQNVSFSYKDGEEVLENFSLKVGRGETIALVGETGSGKSTIVNLICRFYEPQEGRILIDGVDYRERSQLWLQSNIGYVLQDPHLFSGTISENIRYGRLEASDEEVIEAAKLVNAHEFIMKMDGGYNSDVGEGGNRLSTGEKQLISFARAILANPRILVLDEATSSIDTETEQMIQSAINRLLEGRTSFIIAHRLSTIRSADRILVIKDGRMIEQGSHNMLMRQKGYYYRLYTNQFKEERELSALNA